MSAAFIVSITILVAVSICGLGFVLIWAVPR